MSHWYEGVLHSNHSQFKALATTTLATVIASAAITLGTSASAQAVPSLTDQLHAPPQDSIRAQRDVADQFLLVGQAQIRAGDPTQAIAALDEAANAYHYLGDFAGMGEAYEQLVKVYSQLGQYDEAETVVRRQLAIANSNHNFSDQIRAFNNLGTLSLQNGDLDTARAAFDEGLTVARDVDSESGIGLSLSNLGLVAAANGQLNDARKYYEVAANHRARARDYAGQSNTDSNLGDVYVAMGQLRRAVGAYRVALSLASDVNDLYLQLRAIDGLISVYRQLGVPGEVTRYLTDRIELTAATGDDWQRLVTLRTLGEVAQENGDLTAAYEFFQQALQIATALNRKTVQADLSNRVRSLSHQIVD